MGKIINFTLSEFLDQEEKYCDMMDTIESRAAELAREFGKIDEHWHVTDIDIHEECNEFYCCARFVRNFDKNVDKYFDFEANWLFSDDYKEQLAQKETKQQIADDKEYLEYLRLKAKFEGEQKDHPLKNYG